jgi:hypothetical protein
MQCIQLPWDAWYALGKIQFFKAPTEKELATAYFSNEFNIEIADFSRIESGKLTCQACSTCQTSYYFSVTVKSQARQKLIELGWKEEK